MAVVGGLVTYTFDQGCVRLIIPESLRHHVVANLHTGHQGLDSMLRRARQSVYWPGIEGDLQHLRSLCDVCETHTSSQTHEQLVLTPLLDYPFQLVVADLFHLEEHTYLAYANRFTGWLEITHFHTKATSVRIITRLREYFRRWGAPEQIATDGGTNLASFEIINFSSLEEWGYGSLQHTTLSRTARKRLPTANVVPLSNITILPEITKENLAYHRYGYTLMHIMSIN